jgi:hypothetical protein
MQKASSTVSIRMILMAVAVVASSITWSANWSDCKYQAVLHATLANAEKQQRTGLTEGDIANKRRVVEWHEEMCRRFERAAWLPWPGCTSEPPRP